MKLDGKVAIVTGGSRGIGKAIAQCLAREGARVALCSRNLEAAEKSAQEICATGGEAVGLQVNVSDTAAVENMVAETTKRFSKVDILVNNAGMTRDGLLLRMKDDDWKAVLDTNLSGTFNCTKAVCWPMLKNRYGRIVNISSVVGIIGNAGQANYVASKAGVIGFTKAVARELASRGITVNAVAPGFIVTEMTDGLKNDARQTLLSQIPLGRFGQPEDVAKAVLFLVSDDAEYITGHVLTVDGGMAM